MHKLIMELCSDKTLLIKTVTEWICPTGSKCEDPGLGRKSSLLNKTLLKVSDAVLVVLMHWGFRPSQGGWNGKEDFWEGMPELGGGGVPLTRTGLKLEG